jgi:hypothetical protein
MHTAAWVSVIAGTALLTWSAMMITRVNAHRRIPYWTNAKPTPRRALTMRAFGAFFVVVGASMLGSLVGYWSAAFVLAAFIPSAIVTVRHNQRLRAHG